MEWRPIRRNEHDINTHGASFFQTDLHRDVEGHDNVKMDYDHGFGLRRWDGNVWISFRPI